MIWCGNARTRDYSLSDRIELKRRHLRKLVGPSMVGMGFFGIMTSDACIDTRRSPTR